MFIELLLNYSTKHHTVIPRNELRLSLTASETPRSMPRRDINKA